MVSSRDFTVQILSNNRVLEQYDDPEPDRKLSSHEHSKYIEAITEATFKVKVILHPSFNNHVLKYNDVVRVLVYFDNDKLGWYLDFERSYIDQCRASGEPAYREMGNIHKKDPATGKWLRGDLSFGALLTKESNDKNIKPEAVKHLGSIRVTI